MGSICSCLKKKQAIFIPHEAPNEIYIPRSQKIIKRNESINHQKIPQQMVSRFPIEKVSSPPHNDHTNKEILQYQYPSKRTSSLSIEQTLNHPILSKKNTQINQSINQENTLKKYNYSPFISNQKKERNCLPKEIPIKIVSGNNQQQIRQDIQQNSINYQEIYQKIQHFIDKQDNQRKNDLLTSFKNCLQGHSDILEQNSKNYCAQSNQSKLARILQFLNDNFLSTLCQNKGENLTNPQLKKMNLAREEIQCIVNKLEKSQHNKNENNKMQNLKQMKTFIHQPSTSKRFQEFPILNNQKIKNDDLIDNRFKIFNHEESIASQPQKQILDFSYSLQKPSIAIINRLSEQKNEQIYQKESKGQTLQKLKNLTEVKTQQEIEKKDNSYLSAQIFSKKNIFPNIQNDEQNKNIQLRDNVFQAYNQVEVNPQSVNERNENKFFTPTIISNKYSQQQNYKQDNFNNKMNENYSQISNHQQQIMSQIQTPKIKKKISLKNKKSPFPKDVEESSNTLLNDNCSIGKKYASPPVVSQIKTSQDFLSKSKFGFYDNSDNKNNYMKNITLKKYNKYNREEMSLPSPTLTSLSTYSAYSSINRKHLPNDQFIIPNEQSQNNFQISNQPVVTNRLSSIQINNNRQIEPLTTINNQFSSNPYYQHIQCINTENESYKKRSESNPQPLLLNKQQKVCSDEESATISQFTQYQDYSQRSKTNIKEKTSKVFQLEDTNQISPKLSHQKTNKNPFHIPQNAMNNEQYIPASLKNNNNHHYGNSFTLKAQNQTENNSYSPNKINQYQSQKFLEKLNPFQQNNLTQLMGNNFLLENKKPQSYQDSKLQTSKRNQNKIVTNLGESIIEKRSAKSLKGFYENKICNPQNEVERQPLHATQIVSTNFLRTLKNKSTHTQNNEQEDCHFLQQSRGIINSNSLQPSTRKQYTVPISTKSTIPQEDSNNYEVYDNNIETHKQPSINQKIEIEISPTLSLLPKQINNKQSNQFSKISSRSPYEPSYFEFKKQKLSEGSLEPTFSMKQEKEDNIIKRSPFIAYLEDKNMKQNNHQENLSPLRNQEFPIIRNQNLDLILQKNSQQLSSNCFKKSNQTQIHSLSPIRQIEKEQPKKNKYFGCINYEERKNNFKNYPSLKEQNRQEIKSQPAVINQQNNISTHQQRDIIQEAPFQDPYFEEKKDNCIHYINFQEQKRTENISRPQINREKKSDIFKFNSQTYQQNSQQSLQQQYY